MSTTILQGVLLPFIGTLFPVKKVTSSHSSGETVILAENDIDEAVLRSAIGATGYEVKSVSKEPYERKGLFHR